MDGQSLPSAKNTPVDRSQTSSHGLGWSTRSPTGRLRSLPSGLAVYRGDRYPQWQGQIFAGGLVSQDVKRIEVDGNGNVVNETAIPVGQRVRDVRQGPDGFLYVLTDDSNGRLVRLDPVAE
jgi:glucose/arabinose dehydrogenase